jgi:FkbM family methyltransferase
VRNFRPDVLWYNGRVRAARILSDIAGRAVAAAVSVSSSLEAPFISLGRSVSGTRAGVAVYRYSREALIARIRATGRRHRTVDVLGTRILLDVTEREGHEPYFLGVPYEPALTALVSSAPGGGTFIDIGAHTGYFTILYALRTAGRIFAFEPNPRVRAELVANVRLNRVEDRVQVVASAVSSHEAAHTRLFLSSRGTGFSSLVPDAAPAASETFGDSVDVAMTTLDAWLARTGVEPSLIKIDVEGAEHLVLAGMEHTFAERPPPRMVVETSPGSAADTRLRALGYDAHAMDGPATEAGNFLYVHRSVAVAR